MPFAAPEGEVVELRGGVLVLSLIGSFIGASVGDCIGLKDGGPDLILGRFVQARFIIWVASVTGTDVGVSAAGCIRLENETSGGVARRVVGVSVGEWAKDEASVRISDVGPVGLREGAFVGFFVGVSVGLGEGGLVDSFVGI